MADFTLHEGFPNIPIEPGMQLRLTAIDPATGGAVAGVTASLWAIYGGDDSVDNLPDVIPLYSPSDLSTGAP